MISNETCDELGCHVGGAGYDTAVGDRLVGRDVDVVCLPDSESGGVAGHADRAVGDHGGGVESDGGYDATPACPVSLAQARTVHDLVASLVDLVVDKRLDIENWRPQRRRPWNTGRTGTPEWEVLTGRRPPTLPLVVSIVRECGGGPADTSRWEQQWNRIVAPHGRFVGTASPPQRSRGSEPEIALTTIQPVDDDLQRIRDRLAATSDGRAAHPSRPPLWRRLSSIRVRRRLTRRTPGATTDQDLDQ
ncbi:hypothetical protein ACQEVC_10880 [Plantactinospora sp. CA-294935]|uniref:hypothetical protein n=1 Tax=Plantactinospora sp. CA-294935 TaxID=3240012 RepID=UPI003D90423B